MIKQYSSEKDWEIEWSSAKLLHPKEEIIMLKKRTEAVLSNIYGPKSIIGYSGGKDSLVLRHIAEGCIDKPRFITCILENEFPCFEEWLLDTGPKDLAVVYDHRLCLSWLDTHLEYLFPHGKKEKDAYVQTWCAPVHKYMTEHGFDALVAGRRLQDGNYCGKRNPIGCRVSEKKNPHILTCNVIADWSHSQLLAYIQYFGIELPEIYRFPNGFRFGTHPWTERRRLNMMYFDTFDEIMKIDSSIIPNAANELSIAREYMEYLDGKDIIRR